LDALRVKIRDEGYALAVIILLGAIVLAAGCGIWKSIESNVPGMPRNFLTLSDGSASTLPIDASGASVDQVDCLVHAYIEIGHIRRLAIGVFPAQIHVTTLALRYFSPRPLAGFQRA
jgi:hypothetical protein